jgi:CHAT domain
VQSDQHERVRREAEARRLLGLVPWSDSDIENAIHLHDILESPKAAPSPLTSALRRRLVGELRARFGQRQNHIDLLRAEIFASGVLECEAGLARRLHMLSYLGSARFHEFGSGALTALDQAIEALEELEQAVDAAGSRAVTILGEQIHSSLIALATALTVRYSVRRELLLLEHAPAAEKDAIRGDLQRAIQVSRRVVQSGAVPPAAPALATWGSCLAMSYEDDPEQHTPSTISGAIALLEDAVRRLGPGHGAGDQATRLGVLDRLAAALQTRGGLDDIDRAIKLITDVRAQTGPESMYAAGGGLSLATARLRRWQHTQSEQDENAARSAYLDAWKGGLSHHLPAAFDAATQQGGWAWSRGRWAEAGEAYGRAVTTLHYAVRDLTSWPDKQLPIRKAPGVAAMAAYGLVWAEAPEEALVALETGRGVLLAEMFDRRSIDYELLAETAGAEVAQQHELLTRELTELEAMDLVAGRAASADLRDRLEALRRERNSLISGPGQSPSSVVYGPHALPTVPELRAAVESVPVVHLAATGQGGIALVVPPDRTAAIDPVRLPGLTYGVARELAAAFWRAVDTRSMNECDEVCEALWQLVMRTLVEHLGQSERAILIPGGILSALPWHAAKLPGPGSRHVADLVALSYAPNIRALAAARAALGPAGRLSVLAINQPEPTSQRMLKTAADIAAVCAQQSGTFLVTEMPGREATRSAILDSMSRFQAIHFAGHGFAQPDDPLTSGLLMANDEPLTVRDLLAHGVGTAQFAVLSACETARAGNELTDEMVSLPTALLQCGLASVVGSLWYVLDNAAPVMMRVFYDRWQRERMHPALALREAQTFARDHGYGSPLLWASFIHEGP